MKCSESWLREWVDPKLSREELSEILTMAGLEVEEILPVSGIFTNVIIGKVLKLMSHPKADQLKICEVLVNSEKKLQIVCGAPNVKEGMKVPVALINAILPDQSIIKHTQIRGVDSEGMLCSARELGISEDGEGLLVLLDDAPLGEDIRKYLNLDDHIIDISVTPNRGDCLSVKGVARELAALTGASLKNPIQMKTLNNESQEQFKITLEGKGCPRYLGRIIRGIEANKPSPMWLIEKLRRAGVRSINPIVDVTNYVMMELGQPMHAFDLNKIENEIRVRLSKAKEKIKLLDGTEKELDAETLIIADQKKPLAIAGVMGGLDSGVTLTTTDIFLECAFFLPEVVARQRQFYHLHSESAYRYERGVDPSLAHEAITRATQLILEIVGGVPGLITEVVDKSVLPQKKIIHLPQAKIKEILGIDISEKEVKNIFAALHFPFEYQANTWRVEVPLYRFDIILYEDLIEEIARLYGYNKIPTHELSASLTPNHLAEEEINLSALRQAFCDQDYQEIISYPFIDSKKQALLDSLSPITLVNPITNDMTVMRTNLWPGLINTFLYNKSRQQHRIRLFEIGTCFLKSKELMQELKIAALISGALDQEQWGKPNKNVDFYDLKGDIETIFYPCSLEFRACKHPALHPGQTAGIFYEDQQIGVIGTLHPEVIQSLDMGTKAFVFEIDLAPILKRGSKSIQELSKFPEIRRDIAILVNETIPASEIQDTIKTSAGDWLKSVFIFDVYQGKGISPGLKSIALALVLQHPTRTLIDDEVTELMGRVITTLKRKFQAELRS